MNNLNMTTINKIKIGEEKEGKDMFGYCELCSDFTAYRIQLVEMTDVIKGRSISYEGKIAYCKECGSEVFISEVRDENLQALDAAYRKAENIITVLQIKEILDKYNIGKKPLSLLMGWAEVTITRYLEGAFPSKVYSDELLKILADPYYMNNKLEENKANITESAYKKCKKQIEQFNLKKSKLEEAVAYLISQCRDITPLALQKLLYYTQGFNKVFNGEYMFTEDCEAWIHGPVYRGIYEKYKSCGYGIMDYIDKKEVTNFLSSRDLEILDVIVDCFGIYSGKVLEKMTHAETPWQKTRGELALDEYSNRVIDKELIEQYFSEVKAKYDMINFRDIEDYSVDLFGKITGSKQLLKCGDTN